LCFYKVKSWSVKVVDGYILNNQVRSVQCKGCDSATKLVVGNNDDPNLILYGCGGHKCKHTLIRMDFGAANSWAAAAAKATIEKDFPFSPNPNMSN
jgi:hypothetical protein